MRVRRACLRADLDRNEYQDDQEGVQGKPIDDVEGRHRRRGHGREGAVELSNEHCEHTFILFINCFIFNVVLPDSFTLLCKYRECQCLRSHMLERAPRCG